MTNLPKDNSKKHNKKLILYHGSKDIIEKPEWGKGNPYNDYGLGFYCTEHIELAKEWACDDIRGGYANKYELDLSGLKILDLNSSKYTILHWICLLLQNRNITLDSDVAINAKNYIIENFQVDVSDVDIIIGYRADDSYFSYARDFLSNSISLRKLSSAMKLGNLGNQVVLKSKRAFSKIRFVGYEEAPQKVHFPLRQKRDFLARAEYFSDKSKSAGINNFSKNDIYVLDIIRNEMKADDPRLQ